jgi:glycosyltransferase involved in cell wall biosynthesis
VRILIVTQYFWPEDFRINDLVAELVRHGHEVTVLTGYPNYPDGRIYPEYRADPRRFDRYQGATIARVPLVSRASGGLRLVANYASFALSASLIGAFKLRGRGFDAIFAYEPSPITVGVPAAVMRRLKRAPLALWVLDLWPETLQAIGVVRSRLLLALVGRLVAAIYDRCDLILAQSRSFVPQIQSRCTKATPVEYFPSWAESIFAAAPTTEDPIPELPPKDGRFEVMFAGNIGEAQDFPAILDAIELLKDHPAIRWLLVGDGRAAPWVASEIARRGLGDRAMMVGRHPLERMPAFFRRADALLVSLRDQPIFAMTIPAKLQSYFAAGVPIIGMLNGEGAHAIEAAGAGIACGAGDAEGLSRAVLELASRTGAERALLGERGRVYGLEHFDRGRLIARLEQRLAVLKRP